MTRATAVLSPGVPVTLAPAGNISFEIEAGQRVRLTQPEGEQVADFISFNRDDVNAWDGPRATMFNSIIVGVRKTLRRRARSPRNWSISDRT